MFQFITYGDVICEHTNAEGYKVILTTTKYKKKKEDPKIVPCIRVFQPNGKEKTPRVFPNLEDPEQLKDVFTTVLNHDCCF